MSIRSCISCRRLPLHIIPLPHTESYESEITGEQVVPQHGDVRCVWCGSQWNEPKRRAKEKARKEKKNVRKVQNQSPVGALAESL